MELTPISVGSLPKLAELHRKDWPKHIISYNSVKILHDWLVQDPNLDCIKFLSLGDDWKETGTFIWIFYDNVYFDTLEASHDSFKKLLRKFKWSDYYIPSAVRFDLQSSFVSVMQELHIDATSLGDFPLFIFPKTLETEKVFPKGLHCEKLTETHAKIIDDLWPYKRPNSLAYKLLFIKYNPSSGLFDESGKLMGWSMMDVFGTSHSAHVLDEYRRKGYLSLIGWFLRKQIFEKGFEYAAFVSITGILIDSCRRVATEYDKYCWFKLEVPNSNAKL